MKATSTNDIPSFADVHYSLAHDNVFNARNRLRVARQIHAVIQHFLKGKNLHTMTCLDIGCSTGIITNFLSKFFNRTMGIDIDPYAIESAKGNYKKSVVTFQVGSATNLPFADRSFDVIVCHQTLTYIANQTKASSEIYRVLKPGGICFVTCGNYLFPINLEYRLPFLNYLPTGMVKGLLRLAGFKKFYMDKLKTYGGYKKLFIKFTFHDYTLKILRSPKTFRFVHLYKYQKKFLLLPNFLQHGLKYILPQFIFILEK